MHPIRLDYKIYIMYNSKTSQDRCMPLVLSRISIALNKYGLLSKTFNKHLNYMHGRFFQLEFSAVYFSAVGAISVCYFNQFLPIHRIKKDDGMSILPECIAGTK